MRKVINFIINNKFFLQKKMNLKQNKNINGITPLQNYSSAKTSLPSNEPKGFKLIDWQKGTVNLDLGGGKTTFGTDYLQKQDVKNLVFDFNYSISHNKEIAEYVKKNKVDTVTCFNVLNVLDTDAAIENMCLMAAKALKADGTAYFQVYYKKGGKGASQNGQSYQQGEPLSFYVPFVEKYFDDVRKKGDLIIASKPKKTSKKSQWQFAFDSNEGILFGTQQTNELIITIKKKDVRRSLNSCQNEHGQILCAFDNRLRYATAITRRSNHLSGAKLENFDELKNKINEKIAKWKKAKTLDVKDFMLFIALELRLRASKKNNNKFSYYLTIYENKDGFTLRISDHHFNARTAEKTNDKYTTSVTFSNEKPEDWDYFKADPNVNAVEYVYYEDKVTKDDLISIAKDIIEFVETGKFTPSVKPNEINESPKPTDNNLSGNQAHDTTLQKLELQLLSNEIIPDHKELKERIDVLKNRLADRITQRPRLFINKQAYQRWQAYTRKIQKQIDKLESLLRIESLTKNFSEDKLGSLISEPTKQTFYENLYNQLESIVKDDSFEKNGIRNFILSHIPEDYKNDDIEGIVEVFYQRLRALKCGENNELSGLGDIELDTTDYDSKHINNLAPGKNIPESIIENLNKNGMTVENIEKLQDSGFPVCKYKTQITVHGNCPELKSNYVGYYSCLVKNQNNSLGIKWNGIDTEKKERIIKLALDVRSIFKNKEHIITKNGDGYYINNCWNRYWNSTVTYLWQAVTITEGERRYSWQLTQTDKDNINAIAKKISEKLKGLFFGYIEVHYPVIKITILGIYEKNMDKFCQAVFDYTQSEIKELYDEYEKLADEKWQLQQLQRKKAEKERDEYFEEWKKQNPMPENFVPISRYPVKGDIIAEYWGMYTGVSMAKDGGYYFDKESFKPEIVFQKFYNSFGKLCYRRCDKDGNFTERHGDEFKGEYPKDWYLKTNAVTKPKPPEKKPETPTVTTTPGGNSYNLQIVDYSEKGVVLTGDTKPIKDEIKALGGKFGMRFDTSKVPSGVGWIFPKTKLAEIEKLVAKYSTKGGNIETDKALQMLELQLVSDSGLGCLKLDTLSGLTPINKLKRINQIEKLPNETDII